jgi:hypothetical protein
MAPKRPAIEYAIASRKTDHFAAATVEDGLAANASHKTLARVALFGRAVQNVNL